MSLPIHFRRGQKRRCTYFKGFYDPDGQENPGCGNYVEDAYSACPQCRDRNASWFEASAAATKDTPYGDAR